MGALHETIVSMFSHCFLSNEDVFALWQLQIPFCRPGGQDSRCELWAKPSEKQCLIWVHMNCMTCRTEGGQEMSPRLCQEWQWKLSSHVEPGPEDESWLRVQTECAQAQILWMAGGAVARLLSFPGRDHLGWWHSVGRGSVHRVEKASTPRLRITFGHFGVQGTYHSFVLI